MENELNTGYSIVILWKKRADIKYATYDNVKQDMKNIFKRIGILS